MNKVIIIILAIGITSITVGTYYFISSIKKGLNANQNENVSATIPTPVPTLFLTTVPTAISTSTATPSAKPKPIIKLTPTPIPTPKYVELKTECDETKYCQETKTNEVKNACLYSLVIERSYQGSDNDLICSRDRRPNNEGYNCALGCAIKHGLSNQEYKNCTSASCLKYCVPINVSESEDKNLSELEKFIQEYFAKSKKEYNQLIDDYCKNAEELE